MTRKQVQEYKEWGLEINIKKTVSRHRKHKPVPTNLGIKINTTEKSEDSIKDPIMQAKKYYRSTKMSTFGSTQTYDHQNENIELLF